jgi:hypothetical protein
MAKRKFKYGGYDTFDRDMAKDLNMRLIKSGMKPSIKETGKGKYQIFF